jgi:hypothetical protein
MTQTQHVALWIFIASTGLGLFYALIAGRDYLRYLNIFRPLPPLALALASTQSGASVDVLETQAALPAIIDHDPQRRPAQRPPRRRWVTVALAALCVLVIGGIAVVRLKNDKPAPPVSSYIYVNPGHEVIYLEVQGALTQTTGTWIEADKTAHGVTRHQWSFQYGCNSTTVHIVLTTNTGDVTVNGNIDDASFATMDLTLPPNSLGLIPPPAHFVAANWQDWNSAYTSLVAGS